MLKSDVVLGNRLRQVLPTAAGLALVIISMAALADVTWRITLTPKGGGEVLWSTSQPENSGALFGSGSITLAEGAYIDLTFIPFGGYRLDAVVKNADVWTPYLDTNNHYRFGPVSKNHVIIVKFGEITPTGSFYLHSPEQLPTDVAPVYNATGHYHGTVPNSVPLVAGKAFDADVAMDESGKLDILPNSLEGFTPAANKPIIGSLKTVNNLPQVTVSAGFKGVFDGVGGEGSGTATLSGVQSLQDQASPLQAGAANLVAEQTLDTTGVGVYKVVLKNTDTGAKTTLKDKNVDVQLPVVTDVGRDWSVNITLSQRMNAKNKTNTYASATLTLPTGEIVAFNERTVKYSVKKGYNLSFAKGTNQTTNKIDKKSKLLVSNMLFDCSSIPCQLNDGQLKYGFLGQQGKAKLTDFLVE